MLVVAERAVQGRTITIGRAPSNAIVLDDPLVSRHHARLTGGPRQGYRIEDLSGLNGVRINGRPAPGGSVFRDGDRLGIGRTTLVISGGRIVATEPAHTALSADELGFVIKDHGQRKTLLDRVSFRVRSGSLVVVIGPSGAGESTLLRAITGSRPATNGRVVYRGIELYENFASLRQRIGVVPQDDVVHRRLTVRRALRYAAQLRLPADYDAQVREHEVDRVIGDLGPTENADTLISRISGGPAQMRLGGPRTAHPARAAAARRAHLGARPGHGQVRHGAAAHPDRRRARGARRHPQHRQPRPVRRGAHPGARRPGRLPRPAPPGCSATSAPSATRRSSSRCRTPRTGTPSATADSTRARPLSLPQTPDIGRPPPQRRGRRGASRTGGGRGWGPA
ncbi:ATP-binding cassette domain-containing protein [Propionibacterium acidifaciens]|uniref:ATP-binding cassette domain-containing protein n=1 Tax=Propionibacterium acidifaciens TaxID=556499 RepID=UPI00361A30AD